MVEMVEILDGRLGKHSVERVRLCNKQFITLGHCEIWSHFTRTLYFHCLQLVTILSLLVKYLVIFHADPCNKSYISRISIEHYLYMLTRQLDILTHRHKTT